MLSVILSSVAIPVIIALLGNAWARQQQKEEIAVRYVELSTNLLKAEPSEQTKSLRLWAIAVVEHYSEVPLPATAKEELEVYQLGALVRASKTMAQLNAEYVAKARESNDRLEFKLKKYGHLTAKEEALRIYSNSYVVCFQTGPISIGPYCTREWYPYEESWVNDPEKWRTYLENRK